MAQQDVTLRFTLNQADYERVQAALGGMKKGVDLLRTALGGLGVGVGVGAIVAGVKGLADFASQQKALAESAGLSTEAFSALNYAAVQSEASQEDLGKALFKINELLKDGAEKGSKAEQTLRQFGITSEQIRSGQVGTESALRKIADRFNAMPDGIDKSALATQVLGDKLAQRLIPFLNLGSKGFDELAAKGQAAGSILRDDVAEAVAKANDKFEAFGTTIKTIAITGLAAFFGLVEANEGDKKLEELAEQVRGLEHELKRLEETAGEADTGGILGALLHAGDAARVAQIRNELAELRKERDKLKAEQLDRLGQKGAKKAPVTVTPAVDAAAAAKEAERLQKEADEQSKANAEAELVLIENRTKARHELLSTKDRELQQLEEEQKKLEENRGLLTDEQYVNKQLELAEAIRQVGASSAEIADPIDQSRQAMNAFAEQAAHNMQDIVAGFLSGKRAGENFFQSMIRGLADLAAQIAAQQLLKNVFGGLASSTNPFFSALGVAFGGVKAASGGYVIGPGGPTDDKVPAMLSRGEFVLNAAAVSRIGPGILNALNNPGFGAGSMHARLAYATGGLVSGRPVSHAKQTVATVINNLDLRGASDPAAFVQAGEVLRRKIIRDVGELIARDRIAGAAS